VVPILRQQALHVLRRYRPVDLLQHVPEGRARAPRLRVGRPLALLLAGGLQILPEAPKLLQNLRIDVNLCQLQRLQLQGQSFLVSYHPPKQLLPI